MVQEYSEEDDREHISWLANVFKDDRYIKIDSKPLFLVHRVNELPDPLKTTSVWREEAHKLGTGELFLARVESFDERGDPTVLGFDPAVEFQPDWLNLGTPLRKGKPASTLARKLGLPYSAHDFRFIYQDNQIFDYGSMVEGMRKRPIPGYNRLPAVTPSWETHPEEKRTESSLKTLRLNFTKTGCEPLFRRLLQAPLTKT